jgi:uncharacterized protein (DUF3084 family)
MDTILQNPFFKKEHDESNLKTITDLENQLNQAEIDFKKARNNTTKHEDDIKLAQEKLRDMVKEKQHFTDDLRKLTTFNDPSGLTVE